MAHMEALGNVRRAVLDDDFFALAALVRAVNAFLASSGHDMGELVDLGEDGGDHVDGVQAEVEECLVEGHALDVLVRCELHIPRQQTPNQKGRPPSTHLVENLLSELVDLSRETEAGKSDGKVLALLAIVDARVGFFDVEPEGIREELGDSDAESIEGARAGICLGDLGQRGQSEGALVGSQVGCRHRPCGRRCCALPGDDDGPWRGPLWEKSGEGSGGKEETSFACLEAAAREDKSHLETI